MWAGSQSGQPRLVCQGSGGGVSHQSSLAAVSPNRAVWSSGQDSQPATVWCYSSSLGDPATCYSVDKVRALLAVCAEIAVCLQAVLPEVAEFAGVLV